MKNLYRLLCTSTVLLTTAKAAPFLAVGDGAELFATGTVGVRADDNIYTVPNATSDTIFEVTPGVDFTFGKNSDLKGSITLEDQVLSYLNNPNLNANLFSGDFSSTYDNTKSKAGLKAGFHELNQNTSDIQGLTRRNETTGNASTEVSVTEKTAVSASFDFVHTQYRRKDAGGAAYTDSDVSTVPLAFYYKMTEKVDLSLGYRFRDTDEKPRPAATNVAPDSKDHYVSIGARGKFTPKLSGEFSVGYNHRSRDLNSRTDSALPSSSNGLGVESKLEYKYSEKTTINLKGSKDFGTSATGAQQKNTSVNLDGSTNLTDQWSVSAGLSFKETAYLKTSAPSPAGDARSDKYYDAKISAKYIFNNYLNFTGGYNYKKNDSKLGSAAFTNNVFSLAANLRY